MTGNTWTELPDSAVDQSSPVTDVLMTALRDNPKGIAERAPGAPIVRIAQPEILTGSGTWTVPNGVTAFKVTVVGGGGGGARVAYPPLYGYGGKSGTVAVKWYNGVSPGDTFSYSSGAGGAGGVNGSPTGSTGGTSSFDSITAPGGVGGGVISTAPTPVGGDLNIGSEIGTQPYGGSGAFGVGGGNAVAGGGTQGQNGSGYGAGGGGGYDNDGSGDNGGNGSGGVIIIEY